MQMTYKTICAASAVILTLVIGAPKADAVTVLWDNAASNIVGNSDVSSAGTFVSGIAFSFVGGGPGSPFLAPNGQNFTTFYAPTSGLNPAQINGMTIGATGTYLYGAMSNPPNPPPATPYSSLSTGYQNLLRHYNWSSNSGTLNMTLTGLTAGQTYLLQVWYADPANNGRANGNYSINGVASAFLDPNTTNVAGGLGQFINATVTLDVGETSFTLAALNGGGISALQLRAVPEPSTMAALAFGGVIFFSLAYFRRRAVKA